MARTTKEMTKKRLKEIKANVETAYQYFEPNYKRFNTFRKFVFDTTLTDKDIEVLSMLKKPQLEFNILDAYISRLLGEFYKHEPSLKVMASDNASKPADPQMIKVVEGYSRHLFAEAKQRNVQYEAMQDLYTGGFTVLKVSTRYANKMSMHQVIDFDRVFDPTMCGFDPMARLPDKSDGRYCFELFPKAKKDFQQEYKDIDLYEIEFSRTFSDSGFSWSYNTQKEDVIIICDYYEKKKKSAEIVELVGGKTILKDQYPQFVEFWNQQSPMMQAPQIIDQRMTEIETICRYRLIENQVIEYEETDYPGLPLIFAAGKAPLLRRTSEGVLQQMTLPYVYHVIGTQRLKNFAGQTWANELENLSMQKFFMAEESLPSQKEWVDSIKNPQQGGVVMYKAFSDKNPDKPLPPPREVQRPPAPPEVISCFQMTDSLSQMILGSYDAALGINDNQLSGVAILEAATQSNSAAMPYMAGYMQALNRVGQMFIGLFPKYIRKRRTIPILNNEGKREYVGINQQGGVNFDYNEDDLQIQIESGVNYEIEKNRTLQLIMQICQASPLFAEFINTYGLDQILDNLNIRGIEALKEKAQQFMQVRQQAQQKAQQQENPMMLKAKAEQQKVMLQAQQNQVENQIKASEQQISKMKLDNERIKIMADLEESKQQRIIAREKMDTEKISKAAELAMKSASHQHKMHIDGEKLKKELRKPIKGE